MISCREICKLYFWCNDITLFSPYDFYNASKSTFATDVVGCLCQLEASNFGFAPGPKNHRAGPGWSWKRFGTCTAEQPNKISNEPGYKSAGNQTLASCMCLACPMGAWLWNADQALAIREPIRPFEFVNIDWNAPFEQTLDLPMQLMFFRVFLIDFL